MVTNGNRTINNSEIATLVDKGYFMAAYNRLMNKKGPVIVIEDDADDQYLLDHVFQDLACENQIIYFSSGEDGLQYLNKTDIIPFLIPSVINMPKEDGFAIRNRIHSNKELKIKCIPYFFFTAAVSKPAVLEAYSLSVQGFFIKPADYENLYDTLKSIITYCQRCYSPTSAF